MDPNHLPVGPVPVGPARLPWPQDHHRRPAAAVGHRYGHLTPGDRDLLAHVTGEHLHPDLDDEPGPVSRFAARLATDRAAGHLPWAQPVDAGYLLGLAAQSARTGCPDPVVSPVLERALAYVAAHSGHLDVTA
ncbi:hypothetical protein [Kineococcus glutinatus]|uniref:hypothetical protein n=1 Tax=Kineococcus glutinatus TaxID=1070872 RepID=UPI0031E8A3FF